MNILLIDDERDLLEVLAEQISSHFEQAQFTKVFDGIDALIYITEQKYDLIITDHKMSKMNGIEFLYNMQNMKSSLNKTSPIIFLSGFIPEVKQQIRESERTLFLDKPYQETDLIQKINQLITNNKL